jgi:hypothetical protein
LIQHFLDCLQYLHFLDFLRRQHYLQPRPVQLIHQDFLLHLIRLHHRSMFENLTNQKMIYFLLHQLHRYFLEFRPILNFLLFRYFQQQLIVLSNLLELHRQHQQ